MKSLFNIVFGMIIGLVLGIWLGVNIGKDQPLLSNPFAEPTLSDKVKGKAEEIYKDTKRTVRDKLSD